MSASPSCTDHALLKLIGQLEMARYRIREAATQEDRLAEIERSWGLVVAALEERRGAGKRRLTEAQKAQRRAALEKANRVKRETGRLGGRPRKA